VGTELFDVVVIGCGPVGATAGNLLGQMGLRTLVVDRDLAPYDLPRAVHIDHEIMRIFQDAGIAERMLPILSIPAGSMHFGADLGVIRQFHKIVVTDRLGWASDYFFYQPELEAVLRAELAARPNVSLKLGTRFVELQQFHDRVEIVTDTQDGLRSTVAARYVIGCDGGRSEVRRHLGIKLEDLGFEEPWVVVDALVDGRISFPPLNGVPGDIDLQDVMIMLGDPNRPISVIPGHGRHRRWEFMLLPHETAEEAASPAFIDRVLSPWIAEADCEIKRAAVYRFHGLLAEHWRSNRVFLVGDAAHQTPPFFGQGLCHGIRDVANLAWKLRLVIDGVASADLLDSYEIERKPQVRTVVEASIRTGRYICTLDRKAAEERDIAMRDVANQTKPAYFDIIPPLTAGVLDAESAQGTGVRFIQPRVAAADGSARLLDEATGGGFVLLALDQLPGMDAAAASVWRQLNGGSFTVRRRDSANEELAANELLDVTGELEAWYGEHDCCALLLRPDAYVYGIAREAAAISEMLISLGTAVGLKIIDARD